MPPGRGCRRRATHRRTCRTAFAPVRARRSRVAPSSALLPRFGVTAPQLGGEDLAGWSERELVGEQERSRLLVAGQAPSAVLGEGVLADARPCRHDGGG